MKRKTLFAASLVLTLGAVYVWAGIPIPDAILYGYVLKGAEDAQLGKLERTGASGWAVGVPNDRPRASEIGIRPLLGRL